MIKNNNPYLPNIIYKVLIIRYFRL